MLISESEVIRNGLRALFEREKAVEKWLRSEVAASVQELRADPSKVVTVAGMRARLADWHSERVSDSDS